jgi:DNA helicase II / ATP-dependent DNA helicase PcrA
MIRFTHPDLTIYLGPPGTGKTTSLLNVMEAEIGRGVKPGMIGFVSFTKKATLEAKERAVKKFGIDPDKLSHFRTNHSVAFMALGLDRNKVMQKKDYQEIGGKCSVDITGSNVSTEGLPAPGSLLGDRMLFCDHLARNRCISLEKQWKELADSEVTWDMQHRLSLSLQEYKKEHGLFDYTDMLEQFVDHGFVPELDVLIIDEAQDLSALQWRAMQALAKKSRRVYIAGDDDQAIYRWAGADVDQFIGIEGKVVVLDHSYRLPRKVHALSQGILTKISRRREKKFNPRDADGDVLTHPDIESIDMSQGQWLILARNNYLLDRVETYIRDQGYPYISKTWDPHETIYVIKLWHHLLKGHPISGDNARMIYRYISTGKGVKRGYKTLTGLQDDDTVDLATLKAKYGLMVDSIWHKSLDRIDLRDRDYFTRVLKRGEKLGQIPRITLSTIHGAKGGQSDNVVLLTDVSKKTIEEMKKNPDDEHRVFYVGATRTIERLHLVMPTIEGLSYQL